MKRRRRTIALGGALVAGALVLASCSSGGGDTAGEGESGGKYSIAIEEPQSLVPTNCYDLYCDNVLGAMYTGLYEFVTQDDGSVKPELTELTESVTAKNKNKTYEIKIKPDWTFTNGEKITAQTFVDTWNFAANGGNGQQLSFVFGPSQLNVVGYKDVEGPDSTGKKMSGIKALDDTTIQVKLVKPLGEELFNNFMAGPQIDPMPKEAMEDPDAFNKHPIGNGPYIMTEPWSNTLISLKRNPDFKGTPGKADAIDFKVYTDANAQWADLQANNLDVVPNLPPNALATAESVLGDRFINEPGGLSFSYYGFPQQVDTFRNKDVRIAIAKAIDWDQINEKLYYGTRQTATSFAPSTIPGGGTDVCGDKCVFDPDQAKQLLEGAGGLPGNKVRISALSSSTQDVEKAVCNQLQSNLGIECGLKIFDGFGPMLDAYDKLDENDQGFILGLGWGADNPTIQNMIAPLFAKGAPTNYVKYDNPEFDRLIAEGNAASDPEEQESKWVEAETVLLEDFVAYPTQARNTVAGISSRVSNVEVNPQGLVNTNEITVNQ